MIPPPRLSNKSLRDLCHRLAVETEAGIDIRRTWQREADAARGRFRPHFARIRDALAQGESLSLALAHAGPIFPTMFLDLTHVGEETGTLGRVLQRMERHYRRLVQARRAFLAAIAWPAIELGLAILVIGVLILVMGWVAQRSGGQANDAIGFGLSGTSGLLIYMNVLVAIGLAAAAVYYAVRRGVAWTRPLQRAIIQMPVVGPCLQKLALAQIAWTLHLTTNVAMDLRRVAPLALRSTGNDYYIRHTEQVTSAIASGQPLAQALGRTGAFPAGFVDALAVGEESGQIAESMGRLADQYEEEAESAVRTLAMLAGVAVFVLVAALIIFLIFRLFFGMYLGPINDALNGFR
jgi:type IV pilus assembly protein PilC